MYQIINLLQINQLPSNLLDGGATILHAVQLQSFCAFSYVTMADGR